MLRSVLTHLIGIALLLTCSLSVEAQEDKAIEAWLRQVYEGNLIRVHPAAAPDLWAAKLPRDDQIFLDPETRLYLRVDRIRWEDKKLRLDARRVVFYQDQKGEVAQAEAPRERYEFVLKANEHDSDSLKNSLGRLLEQAKAEQIDWSGYWPPWPDGRPPLDKTKQGEPAREIAPAVFRPGVGVSSPKCRFCPNPQPPLPALQGRSDGMVVVSALVTETGHVGGMRIVESTSPRFSEASVLAFSRWRYAPATGDGKPVRVVTTIEMMFRIHSSP